ncbi:hypothetical protein GPECTOR_23g81 [Gonium pectorale]|uniref:Uncharacterized protein n=1 Tax=Gonium pectorale TaxID=33097 RepID=A0A150GH54_GONPE|nr:hypothetical protein GPECTOR_23g81 [Gonium pectorale]|eukprot:KXZ49154.1 hypothetical protein GPECTOR_23g81 [Gonium pectorale]
MELEAQHCPLLVPRAAGGGVLPLPSPNRGSPMSSVDERELLQQQPGLMLGQTEIDPALVHADWAADHADRHDPHAPAGLLEDESNLMGMQAGVYHEDYDEVMGQIVDAQRSGWSEDGVNGGFRSDVY